MPDYLHSDETLMRYIDNEMSEAEREDFEKNLTSNPALRQQLERLLMARNAVGYFGLAQNVEAIRKQWEGKSAPAGVDATIVPIKKYVRYIFAAACVVILAIGITTTYRYFALSSDKIYRQTYIAYTPGNSRSEAGTPRPIEEAYAQKNFKEVISRAQGVPLDSKDRLLLGLSYLEVNNPPAAVQQFDIIRSGSDPTFREDAEFYLALAFIKNKQPSKALPLFEKIFNDKTHLYHQQVTEETIRDVKSLI